MEQPALADVIDLCRQSDALAAEIYFELAMASEPPEVHAFFMRMHREECGHVTRWAELADVARAGGLPEVFGDPARVARELDELLARVRSFHAESRQRRGLKSALLLAAQLEFSLLHPAMTTLFELLATFSRDREFLHGYTEHLDRFIADLRELGREIDEVRVFSDAIAWLWSKNQRLQVESHVDALTTALNRRGFVETVKPLAFLARRGAADVGVFMVDVDDFKRVNDERGHADGDRALRRVVDLVRATVRQSDVVGRMGGEEFAVFLSPVAAGDLATVAERLRESIAADRSLGFPLTVSVGVALGRFRGDVETELTVLLERADAALLEAKRAGKNRVVIAA